jgi:hypothetical protein
MSDGGAPDPIIAPRGQAGRWRRCVGVADAMKSEDRELYGGNCSKHCDVECDSTRMLARHGRIFEAARLAFGRDNDRGTTLRVGDFLPKKLAWRDFNRI